MYWDVNHPYSWVMCERLPTHGFKWVGHITIYATVKMCLYIWP